MKREILFACALALLALPGAVVAQMHGGGGMTGSGQNMMGQTDGWMGDGRTEGCGFGRWSACWWWFGWSSYQQVVQKIIPPRRLERNELLTIKGHLCWSNYRLRKP